MRLLLLTTSDRASDRGADLERLFRSIAANRESGLDIQHVILLQRCSEAQRRTAEMSMPYPATVLASEGRLSLSAARNVMLAAVRANGLLGRETVVGFPDDDCWYTPGFAARLVSHFHSDRGLGLLISRVSLSPQADWQGGATRVATAKDVLRRSSSNGIFVRGDVAAVIGDFDSNLGLGTPNTSGEDTDYALRASFQAQKCLFVDLPLIGHREADLASVTKYFSGNMVVASRYALRSPGLFLEYVRKFGVGSYLVIRNRLGIGDFINAIQGSMRTFGRSLG